MNHRDESEKHTCRPICPNTVRAPRAGVPHSALTAGELGSPSISVSAHVPGIPCRRWLVRSEARGRDLSPRAAAVARATLSACQPACSCHTARTVGLLPSWPSVSCGEGTCIGASGRAGGLWGSLLSAAGVGSFTLLFGRGRTVQCEGQCTPCRWEGGGCFWMVSPMAPRLAFEAGFETPCWFFSILEGCLSWWGS